MLEIREAMEYYNSLMRSIDNASGMPATPINASDSTRRRGLQTLRQEEAGNSRETGYYDS